MKRTTGLILLFVTLMVNAFSRPALAAELISSDILFYYPVEPQPANLPDVPLDPDDGTNVNVSFLDPPPAELPIFNNSGFLDDFDQDIYALREKQSTLLDQDLFGYSILDITTLPLFPDRIPVSPDIRIPSGTVVSSYLFVFTRPGGMRGVPFQETPRAVWQGTLTFDRPVAALVEPSLSMLGTTEIIGLDEEVSYDLRSVLDGEEDIVTFSGNQVNFLVGTRYGKDPFRVILLEENDIQAVPEPLTILGAITAVGIAGLFKHKR